MSIAQPILQGLHSGIHELRVFAHDGNQKKFLGTLNCNNFSAPSFQWSDDAIQRGEQWSPLRMPVQKHVQTFTDLPPDFDGLPGLLHDSLPDGWGLMVMNRFLEQIGFSLSEISPAVRLSLLGDRSWGALCFEPDCYDVSSTPIDLHDLTRDVHQLMAGKLPTISPELFLASSSLHGARPKIMVDLNNTDQARLSLGSTEPSFDSWIIKFAAVEEHPDAPLVEQAYMDLARTMSLNVCESRILSLNGRAAFATKRFDRIHGGRQFTHSLSGLLHTTHRQCNLDYINIGQILTRLNAADELEQAFRRACFNVALSVRDDHSKNISFIKQNGRWGLSPAYDLTYMQGPRGYHSMNYADCPERDPTRKFVLQVGINYGLEPSHCEYILNEALDISNQFASSVKKYDASKKLTSPIEKRLQQVCKNLRPSVVAARKRSV